MGHIKEPIGVDLNVSPTTLSAEDRQTLSAIIAQYKLTKEVPQSKPKLVKTVGRKKATATRAKNRKPAPKKAASNATKSIPATH